MNILKAYYEVAYELLKEHLPVKPELILSNAKGYDGKIVLGNGKVIIKLSKWNLEVSDWLIDEEDINEIVDTICHEFAHMFFWNHDDDHKGLTNAFKSYVLSELKIRFLEKKLVS